MAIFTVDAKVVFMRIGMTTIAIFERNAGKPLIFRAVSGFLQVTIDTGHRFVFAGQRKISFVVNKFAGGLKGVGRMAFRTIIAQCFLVRILVTNRAIPAQSQVSIFPFL